MSDGPVNTVLAHRRPRAAGIRVPEWIDATSIVAVLAVVMSAWLGLEGRVWADWGIEARPSVDALLSGHLGAFFRLAPTYGGSLLLRSPFMALGRLSGHGPASDYPSGALPCLLAAAGLAIWLSAQMKRRGAGFISRATAVALCTAGPIGIAALQQGHPEDLLGAVLCVAAVLCAQRDRAIWSGVLVGLAIANKDWGILAAGPVLVALPSGRVRALAAMVATTGIALAPFVLMPAGGFVVQTKGVALQSDAIFGPLQLWWFFGSPVAHGARVGPAWLAGLGHTLPVAMMVPLTLAFALRARREPARRTRDAMLLLALLLLLRCALDPWDVVYYPVPFLTALLAWETTTHDRPPVVALTASLVTWYVFQGATYPLTLGQNTIAAIFAGVTAAAICAIGRCLFAPASARPGSHARVLSRRPGVPDAGGRVG